MQKGFTLFELIVTVAVLGIFATIAAPSLSSMLDNNRIKTTQSESAHFLTLARSEAVKSGKSIEICSSIDGQSCIDAEQTQWNKSIIARQADYTDSSKTNIVARLDIHDQQLIIQAPEKIVFTGTGSAEGEYQIQISMLNRNSMSVCLAVSGVVEKKSGDQCDA